MRKTRSIIWGFLLVSALLLPITLYTTKSWNIPNLMLLLIFSVTLADTLLYYCYTVPKEKRKIEEYNIRLAQISQVYEELGASKEALEGIRGQLLSERGSQEDGHKREKESNQDSI